MGISKGLAGVVGAAVLSLSIPVLAQLGADNKPMNVPRPRAPQASDDCGKAWHDQYNSMSRAQRSYSDRSTQAIIDDQDVDGEGSLDLVLVSSDPTIRPCEMTGAWNLKQNRIFIRYDADHEFEYSWQGQQINGLRLYKEKRMIQVYGTTPSGDGWQQTIPYTLPEGR